MPTDDIVRQSVSLDQTMSVMVVALVATINTFIKEEDEDKTKRDLSWLAITLSLHGLLMPSKHKDIAIKVLETLIQELKDAQPIQAPI